MEGFSTFFEQEACHPHDACRAADDGGQRRALYAHARYQQKIQKGVEDIHHRGEYHRLFCQAMAANDNAHGVVQRLLEQENAHERQVIRSEFKHCPFCTDKTQHRTAEEKHQQADQQAGKQMEHQCQRCRPGGVFLLICSQIL